MGEERVKVLGESSVPVQSRVSVISLAELDMYWIEEGYNIKTMSQLISNSLGLLCEVLRANSILPKSIDSVVEANRHLEIRGLHQKGMKSRGFKKLGAAITFESLREQGIDPEQYASRQFNRLHRKPNKHTGEASSVEPYEGRGISSLVQRATELYHKMNPEIKDAPAMKVEIIGDGTRLARVTEDKSVFKEKMSGTEFEDRMLALERDNKKRKAEEDAFLASVRKDDEIV